MKILFEIQDKMEDELRSICRKEEMSRDDLDNIYKMVDIVKDITTVDAMHKAEYDGYSRDGRDMYSRGWDVDYSYVRGRDAMGRYTSRDDMPHHSMHEKQELIDHLTGMMRSARSEEERENYRRTIDQLSR